MAAFPPGLMVDYRQWNRTRREYRYSRAALVRMYVEERQTIEQVACRVGCSKTTMHRALIELGIPVRPRGGKI